MNKWVSVWVNEEFNEALLGGKWVPKWIKEIIVGFLEGKWVPEFVSKWIKDWKV
jgi:hypothetical protein